MHANVRVSGNIISELSEKIPNNTIALNELMKNSYDAGASYVSLTINYNTKTLVVKDDGCGMDFNDIQTLFHISNSEKKYGEINQYGRYTQGSKGLGFLSVFKFGSYVTWKTKKVVGLEFIVDFASLSSCDDISTFEIPIQQNDNINNGTEITVQLDTYGLTSLVKYLGEPSNSKKIVNAFDDDLFEVILNFNGMTLSSKDKVDINNILTDRKLYKIEYNSKDGEILFYVNGSIALKRPFFINDTRYSLELELIIFQLMQYDKRKISELFYNPQGELTPLVYVNSNFFANYTLFDPNIMRHIRSALFLGQMIGYVRLTSNSPLLNFNSDRTQFLQNELTDKIIDFLSNINNHIQTIGSKYKIHLIDFDILNSYKLPADAAEKDFRNNIRDTFSFKDDVNIEKKGKLVVYSIFGKTTHAIIEEKAVFKPAQIILKDINKKQFIPTEQIRLSGFILQVKASNGADVPVDQVDIFVDGIKSETKILNSITEQCTHLIKFEYIDPTTGKIVKEIELQFCQREAVVTSDTTKNKLLTIPARQEYTVSFNYSLERLILELNNLIVPDNLEIIACSLRALFEISTDALGKTTQYSTLYSTNLPLEEKVKKVVEYIITEKRRCSTISCNSGIGYHDLMNSLVPDGFFNVIKSAHLGAHKTAAFLSEPEIKTLANKASLFVVIVNEMLKADI